MKYHIAFIFLFSHLALASMSVYERPSDEEVFNGSDVVAIVRTTSGEVIPIENGGGIKVIAKVLYPIKGAKKGAEIQLYYGAGSIGGRYVATLVWDDKLNGYKYFDPNMSYEVFHIDTIDQGFLDPQEISQARGFKGKLVKPKDGVYYIPSCGIPTSQRCQEAFDQIQYIMKKAN